MMSSARMRGAWCMLWPVAATLLLLAVTAQASRPHDADLDGGERLLRAFSDKVSSELSELEEKLQALADTALQQPLTTAAELDAQAVGDAMLPFAGNLTYVEPTPGYYVANRTVFVAAQHGSSSPDCGAVDDPCADVEMAFGLADNVVLMPGTHHFARTLALKRRYSVSLVGLAALDGSRPRLAMAVNGSFSGAPALAVIEECGSVLLDTLEVSGWSCSEHCWPAAVNVKEAGATAVSNCLFAQNNVDTEPEGAVVPVYLATALAVSSSSGTAAVRGCIFSNNSVAIRSPRRTSMLGAAVTVQCLTATFSDTTFLGNWVRATAKGTEPVAVFGSAVSSWFAAKMTDCLVFANTLEAFSGTVNLYGGGIFATGNLTLSSTVLQSNAAIGYAKGNAIGGVLTLQGNFLSVSNCTFSESKVVSSADSTSICSGGAVAIEAEGAIFNGCSFWRNILEVGGNKVAGPSGTGGALSIYTAYGGLFEMNSCNFTENGIIFHAREVPLSVGSSVYGGAVGFVLAKSPVVLFEHCRFEGNVLRAGRSRNGLGGTAGGGAIAFAVSSRTNNPTVLVVDSDFSDNIASAGPSIFGSPIASGGALLTTADVEVQRCLFSANAVFGGAVYGYFGAEVGGSAGGGALSCFGHSSLSSCVFSSNYAIGGEPEHTSKAAGNGIAGAALLSNYVNITACTFRGNYVTSSSAGQATISVGGAAFVLTNKGDSYAFVDDCGFYGNYVEPLQPVQFEAVAAAGAALSIRTSGPAQRWTNCMFEDNSIQQGADAEGSTFGGALVVVEDASFVNMTLLRNGIVSLRQSYGGAVAFIGAYDYVLENVLFDSNFIAIVDGVELGFGGGFYNAWQNPAVLTNVTFTNNTAAYGGGMGLWRGPITDVSTAVEGAVFYNNSAPVAGGAAYFYERSWDTSVECGIVGEGNTAGYGDDCASNVAALSFVSAPPQQAFPGQTLGIVLRLVDAFKNFAIGADFSVRMSSSAVLETTVAQDTVLPTPWGQYDFSRARIFGDFYSTAEVSFAAIPGRRISAYEAERELSINSTLELYPCPADLYASSATTCSACEQASYNFDGDLCQDCPETGVQCVDLSSEGDVFLAILAGYYPSSFTQPAALAACPLPASCPGYQCTLTPAEEDADWVLDCSQCPAATAGDSADLDCMCAAGYTGRLCSECLFTEEVCYYRSNGECRDASSLPLGLWGPSLELVAYVAVTIFWLSLRQDAEKGSVKTLVFFLQTSAALCESAFFPYGAVNLLASVTSGVVLNWLNVASLRCVSYTLFSHEVVEVLVLSLMPLLVFWPCTIVVHAAAAAFRERRRRHRAHTAAVDSADVTRALLSSSPPLSPPHSPLLFPSHSPPESPATSPSLSRSRSPSQSPPLSPRGSARRSPRHTPPLTDATLPQQERGGPSSAEGGRPGRWAEEVKDASVHSFLYVLYSSFFNVCSLLFASWGCSRDPGTGAWYSIQLPWMECAAGSGWLPLLVTTVCLAALVVAGPMALFTYLLYANRERLEEEEVFARLGFLYGSYRREVYWWELVALVRRLLLALSLAMFANSNPLYSCVPAAVLCCSVALQAHFRPFHTHGENILEILALALLLATFQASQFLHGVSSLDSFSLWTTQLAVLAANGLLLAYMLLRVGREVVAEFKPRAWKVIGRAKASVPAGLLNDSVAALSESFSSLAHKARGRTRRAPSVQAEL